VRVEDHEHRIVLEAVAVGREPAFEFIHPRFLFERFQLGFEGGRDFDQPRAPALAIRVQVLAIIEDHRLAALLRHTP
jgi:hypothetical protein